MASEMARLWAPGMARGRIVFNARVWTPGTAKVMARVMGTGMARVSANGLATVIDSLMHRWADGAPGEFSRATAKQTASADRVLLMERGN